MSNRGTTSKARVPRQLASAERVLIGADPPMRIAPETLERIAKLRALLAEGEKICSWISSAVNTPELPAGSWIYVDALRMVVLAGIRNAHLLELHVKRLAAAPPTAGVSR